MKRLLYCLLLAPLCLSAAGCVENVWLPDSSGFVCFTREHALVHYDLAKKTQRVVVKFDWLHSEEEVFERPAISPDGKRVALVRHMSSKDAETAQILIYDLASGKEVEKSEEIVLPGHADFSPKPLVRSGMIFWAPDGKHMLFQVDAPLFKDGQRVKPQLFGDEQNQISITTLGLYDLSSKKHVLCTNLALDPEDVMSGFQPFAPDNRGAIVFRVAEKGKKNPAEADAPQGWQAAVFLNWEGREQNFKMSKALIEAEEKDRQEREKLRKGGQRTHDDLTPPHWDGTVAVVPTYRGVARLSTGKMTADYQPDERSAARIQYARKNKVDVMGWKDGLLVQFRDSVPPDAPPKPDRPDEEPPERKVDVELVSGDLSGDTPAGKTVKAIRVGDIEAWTFSPNREYLLLRCIEPSAEGERCRRVVIDAKGKVVADFTEKTAVKPPELPDMPVPPAKELMEPPPAPIAPPPPDTPTAPKPDRGA